MKVDSPAWRNALDKIRLWNADVPHTLIASRAIRGVGQGMMLADFALYLRALGWNAAGIGALLSLGALGEIIACIFVGWAGGRGSKKLMLIVGESLTLAACLIATYSKAAPMLAAASLLGGLGQRSNGSPGPFSPAEQALFADFSSLSSLGAILSINSATGFAGLGTGALTGAWLVAWGGRFSDGEIFRPLFIFSATAAFANMLLLASISEPPNQQRDEAASAVEDGAVRRSDGRSLSWLVLTNLLNGAAIGMADLLVPFWFAKQFHARPSSISLLMALTFFLTALLACTAAFLVYRVGHLKLLLRTQFISAGLLVVLPLIPLYWLACAILAARYALTRSPAGVRQTLTNASVQRKRIGLATGLNVSSLQAGQLFAPLLAGLLMDHGRNAVPFFLAAACQAFAVRFYKRSFRELALDARTEPTLQGSEPSRSRAPSLSS